MVKEAGRTLDSAIEITYYKYYKMNRINVAPDP